MGVVDKAVEWIKAIANDDSHGYDQQNRWGADFDCSSLVISAYKQAGVNLSCTYTGNMKSDMLANGFHLVTDRNFKAGDVLLNERSHTAMYIGNGMIAQASSNENGGIIGGKTGDQTGKEIGIRTYYDFPWDCVLRYEENDSEHENTVNNSGEYIVQKGDSLWTISKKVFGYYSSFGVETLKSMNGITGDLIKVGDRLKVPVIKTTDGSIEDESETVSVDLPLLEMGDNNMAVRALQSLLSMHGVTDYINGSLTIEPKVT